MSDTRQMVAFERLKEILDLRGFGEGHESLVKSREGLEWLLRPDIRGFPLDEAWYRKINSGIDLSTRSGAVQDAKTHLLPQGYVEEHAYCPQDFHKDAYLAKNRDL